MAPQFCFWIWSFSIPNAGRTRDNGLPPPFISQNAPNTHRVTTHITHFFPTQVWRSPKSAPHFANSLGPAAILCPLPLPSPISLHFEGWFLPPCTPWHRLNVRGRKEVGGAARGRTALTLCWLMTLGVGTAKQRLRMCVCMLRARSQAGRALPALPLFASKWKQPHHPGMGRRRPQLYLHNTRDITINKH